MDFKKDIKAIFCVWNHCLLAYDKNLLKLHLFQQGEFAPQNISCLFGLHPSSPQDCLVSNWHDTVAFVGLWRRRGWAAAAVSLRGLLVFVKGTETSTRKRISGRSLIFVALTTHNDVWSGRRKGKKKPNQQQEIHPGVVFRVEEQPGPAAKRRTTCYSSVLRFGSVQPGGGKKYDFISTHSARLPERWRKVQENSIRRHIRKPGYSHGVIWKNVHAELISRCLSLTAAPYFSLGARWFWLCHQ